MKRRISLVGIALGAILLALGVAVATAAKNSPSAKPLHTSCTTHVTAVPPPDQTAVTPPVQQGNEYGPASCGTLGHGLQGDKVNVPSNGDELGNYTLYLPTGTLRGTFHLVPQDDGSLNFSNTDYKGTLTITGGSGTLAGAHGSGKMTCNSPDGVHTNCTDKVTLTQI